mgnify:CR=1 FL=1
MSSKEEVAKIIKEKTERIEHLLHRRSKDIEYQNYSDAEAKDLEIESLEMEIEDLDK